MYIHYYICPQQLSNYVHTLLHLSTCHVESNSCQTMYICPPVMWSITAVKLCTCIHYYICPQQLSNYVHTLLHLSTCHVASNSCQTVYIINYICPPVTWRVTAVKLVHITTKWVSSLILDCNGVFAIKAYSRRYATN